MFSRGPAGLLLLALLNACASVAPARPPTPEKTTATQLAVQSCTATGPAAVPGDVRPGLQEGPHTIIINGVRLWYCVAGAPATDRAPVVYLHGGPGGYSYDFAVLAGPRLEPSLRMVYFDQRGSGHSERPWTEEYSMETLVEDVEGLRRALGVPRIALLGHSFGVTLALEYAAKYPAHVSRMVLVGGLSDAAASGRSMCLRLAEVNPEAYARARTATDGGPAADPGECNIFKALSGSEAQEFFQENMYPDPAVRALRDSVKEASGLRQTGELQRALFKAGLGQWRFTEFDRLTMPVLVIAGRHDYQVGMEAPRELARSLPQGQLQVYERGGHHMYLDEPERFAREVTEFLNGASP